MMYTGPSGTDMVLFFGGLLLLGALLGIGCNAGCSYVRSHASVGWR